MIFTDIEKEALSLTLEEQTQLVNSLVTNIESTTDAEISHSWALESLRRLKELEDGTAKEIPLEDVLRRARMAIS
jgi:putative addiction module component (TIGR02574 family)